MRAARRQWLPRRCPAGYARTCCCWPTGAFTASSCGSWPQVAARLWRVSATLKLPVQQVLADGSYLSTIYDSADKSRRHGSTVRVIEYALQGSATPTEGSYQLITTLLDAEQAPGLELAALYHERWEIEGVFDEFKTHLRGASTVLRSKTPRSGSAGAVGAAAGTLRRAPAHGTGGLATTARSGPPELRARRARDQAKTAASRGHSSLSASKAGAKRCSPRSGVVAA